MSDDAMTAVAGADLDLVEIALDGGPWAGVERAGALVLVDGERTPVARLDPSGGIAALQPLAPRPELSGGAVASTIGAPELREASLVAVFDGLPSRAQLAALESADAASGPLAFVGLVGRGRRAVLPGALLAALHAVASTWSARTGRRTLVVAVPWSLDARPALLPVPPELADAEALATWLGSRLESAEVLVFGPGDEHHALERIEEEAAGAARALFPAEVLPFHRGERGGGTVVLLTGLSGSGKSTVARAVSARLAARGEAAELLDGDEVRLMLSAGLGFDAEGRALNIRRIGWVASRLARLGATAIAAPIAPFAAGREEMRRMAEEAGARFLLVHVATSLEVSEERDRKGLYAAARAGRIADFTGISSPYEEPLDADLRIDTGMIGVDEAAETVLDLIDRRTP